MTDEPLSAQIRRLSAEATAAPWEQYEQASDACCHVASIRTPGGSHVVDLAYNEDGPLIVLLRNRARLLAAALALAEAVDHKDAAQRSNDDVTKWPSGAAEWAALAEYRDAMAEEGK